MRAEFAIFDMDGTLVDSTKIWNQLSREYFSSLGVTPSPQLLEQTAHLSMPETAAFFVQAFHLPCTPEQVAEDINSLMAQHYRLHVPLKPGVLTWLDHLRRAGVAMCVASSTAPALIDLCLRRLEVREYFKFLLSSEEVGAGKDRPDIYLEATRRMGGLPTNTLVFEDLLSAARTAKSAGFVLAAVCDESSPCDQEAVKNIADYYIPRWDDRAVLEQFLHIFT